MTAAIQSQTFIVPRPTVRRNALLFGLITSAVVIAVTAIGVKEWDFVAVLDIACILGLIWLIALTESWLVYWVSKRNLRLHVGSDGLCLEQGASRQLVPWNAITQVEVRSESGLDLGIDIYTANGRELEVQDFERLSEIVNLVKAGVPPTIPVKRI